MQIEKKIFTKLFKETHGVKLSLISDLQQATVDADNARENYYNVDNDWVNRYLDLLNEVAGLNNVRNTYVERIEKLRDVMGTIRSQVESLGIDPRTIAEFEDALLTDGIFNANIDESIETINVANNMTQL